MKIKSIFVKLFTIVFSAFIFALPVNAQSDDGSVLGIQDDVLTSGVDQSALSTGTSNDSPVALIALVVGILLLSGLIFLLARRRKRKEEENYQQ